MTLKILAITIYGILSITGLFALVLFIYRVYFTIKTEKEFFVDEFLLPPAILFTIMLLISLLLRPIIIEILA